MCGRITVPSFILKINTICSTHNAMLDIDVNKKFSEIEFEVSSHKDFVILVSKSQLAENRSRVPIVSNEPFQEDREFAS